MHSQPQNPFHDVLASRISRSGYVLPSAELTFLVLPEGEIQESLAAAEES